jgi:flagellar biosynthetic protein FliQ
MNTTYVISFFQDALTVAATLSMPALLLGLVVGLTVSVFQAVTQIQEQTLMLIPKIVAIVGALMLFGNWMLTRLVTFTEHVFVQIQNLPG